MAPAQHPEPAAAVAPTPVLTCHDTAPTATRPAIPRTRETAPRGLMRGLRAIIAISRCDPMPPALALRYRAEAGIDNISFTAGDPFRITTGKGAE